MALYSKEYTDLINQSKSDFSYIEYFYELDEGEYIAEICEGLGTFGITKKNNTPYLIINLDGEIAEYSSYISGFKATIDNSKRN